MKTIGEREEEDSMAIHGVKVRQTVTPDGRSIHPSIAGIKVHQPPTQQDERGTLFEIFSPHWGFDSHPLVYAYAVTVRPGAVKGWALHEQHVDRYFFIAGTSKLVLYDSRPNSPTRGMVTVNFYSELNRSLVSVPPLVYHAVENVGTTESLFVSFPSEPYNHGNPDKYVLPPDSDLIPYKFVARGPAG
jgi:dTDP-4-dehydrorhamnose 3,5-epimerase